MMRGSGRGFLTEQEPHLLGALSNESHGVGYPPLSSHPSPERTNQAIVPVQRRKGQLSKRGSFDKKATKVINGIILKQGYVRLDACWWHVITDDG